MEFIIDNRETKIKEYFKSKKNIKFENLKIGDFQIKWKNEIKYIIERKTLADYSSSIKDGRYKEQKIRLSSSKLEPNNIIYLIEGKLEKNKKISGISTDTLLSSIISLMIRDKFKILKTNNLNESIMYLDKLYNKILQNGDKWFSDNNKNDIDIKKDYVSSIKLNKKDNITPNNCYILQLSQIPGISTNIAKIIAVHYPNFYSIYKDYDKLDNDKEKKNLFSNIKYPIANNKERRIGEKISIKIYDFLNYSSENKIEKNI